MKPKKYNFNFKGGEISVSALEYEEAKILAQAEAIRRGWDCTIIEEENTIKHIDYCEFLGKLKPILESSVGKEYANYIIINDNFFSAVREDVEETSAWRDEGYYTEDDIRLAIGRAIMEKFNIDY